MKNERLDAWTRQGRRVAVWRSAPDAPQPAAPVIVLNAGFARRMRDVGAIALCLVHNGAVVYRFDAVDHIGLSEGEVTSFTLTGVVESCRAAIATARAAESRTQVRLVTLSLATLAALRLAADDPGIERVLAISGVVNGLKTLEKVTGQDYATVSFEALPERVRVMGYQVDPRPLWRDHHETGCLHLDQAVAQLARIQAPVANCVASEDPWVDIDDCSRCFAAGGGERLIVSLPYSGHDLGRNPVAITTVLEQMTRMAVGTGPLASAGAVAVDMPGFDELLELRIAERDQEANERAIGPGGGAA